MKWSSVSLYIAQYRGVELQLIKKTTCVPLFYCCYVYTCTLYMQLCIPYTCTVHITYMHVYIYSRVFTNDNVLPLLAVITSPEIYTISMFMRLGSLYHVLHDLNSGQWPTDKYMHTCMYILYIVYSTIHTVQISGNLTLARVLHVFHTRATHMCKYC